MIDRLTIEDYENLPDALAHNHDLINGELVDVSGNLGGHNCLRDAILEVLGPYVRSHQLGRVTCGQSFDFDGDAYGPDLSFYGPAKAPLRDGRLRVQRFVPDLTIEIASQNDRFDVLLAKALRCRRCGVAEVYIFSIVPRQVFLYSERPPVVLVEAQDFQSPLIPGFSIKIADLFAMI